MSKECEHGYFLGRGCDVCTDMERAKRDGTNLVLENVSLRSAIRTFGQHTHDCASHTSREGKWLDCDCGWEECEWNPENQ